MKPFAILCVKCFDKINFQIQELKMKNNINKSRGKRSGNGVTIASGAFAQTPKTNKKETKMSNNF